MSTEAVDAVPDFRLGRALRARLTKRLAIGLGAALLVAAAITAGHHWWVGGSLSGRHGRCLRRRRRHRHRTQGAGLHRHHPRAGQPSRACGRCTRDAGRSRLRRGPRARHSGCARPAGTDREPRRHAPPATRVDRPGAGGDRGRGCRMGSRAPGPAALRQSGHQRRRVEAGLRTRRCHVEAGRRRT